MRRLWVIMAIWLVWWVSYALDTNEPAQIYTHEVEDVFDDAFIEDNKNPIRQGIDGLLYDGWDDQRIGGIWRPQEINDFDTAKNNTIDVVQMFINYALWLVSLIALIYLIVHGFMIMTAMGDDTKVKKWFTGIRTAGIAIAGIALSRLVVTLIFYVIWLITS